jgi:hypothetical protein
MQKSTSVFLELLVVSLIRKQLSGVAADLEYDDSDVILEEDGAVSGSYKELTIRTTCRTSRILGPIDVVSIDGKFGCCRAVAGLERFLSEIRCYGAVDLTESPVTHRGGAA